MQWCAIFSHVTSLQHHNIHHIFLRHFLGNGSQVEDRFPDCMWKGYIITLYFTGLHPPPHLPNLLATNPSKVPKLWWVTVMTCAHYDLHIMSGYLCSLRNSMLVHTYDQTNCNSSLIRISALVEQEQHQMWVSCHLRHPFWRHQFSG